MALQMQKPTHTMIFITIFLILIIRDLFYPPKYVLNDTEIKSGIHILDFGCGPGSYSIAAAERLEETGKVFALDMHPIAVKQVDQKARKKKLTNVKTIFSNCDTGLPSNSVDIILLYYVFNDLENPEKVLQELYRVLKPQGILSFSEFNVKKISPNIEKKGLFRLEKMNEITHTFTKIT